MQNVSNYAGVLILLSMKIRIVDIAKKAEVSVGTVDRYIHKRGKVSKKAAEKIQLAIKELGYEPDIMARNLALKKEHRIACVLPNPEEIKYWERPYTGIDKAISELSSFKVLIDKFYFTPRTDSFKEVCQQVLSKQYDGVVYVPMFFEESKSFAQQLNATETPFIHFNIHHSQAEPLAFIGQHAHSAGQLAASLCQMTLKTDQEILITYVLKEQQEFSHHEERIDGFMDFRWHNTSKPKIHHLTLKIEETEKKHETILLDFLANNPKVQIIFVPNSRAYRIASILKKNQILDKMIIGFDTLEENVQFLNEGMIDVLIGQQSKAQGYNAVMLMFNYLFKKEDITGTHYLPIDILNQQNIEFYEGLLK
jgi:LacI family transcriptional regulator